MKPILAFDISQIKLGQTDSVIGGTYGSVNVLISVILNASITIASIIFLGLLIFGGITFIMNAGSGDAKKTGQGKAAITNALIGLAIVLLAFTIIQIIEALTGLTILKSTL